MTIILFSNVLNEFCLYSSRVLSNQFVAHIVSREPQLSVILYKSSSGREINMNEWILDQVAEKASPIPLKVDSFLL